MGDPTFTEDEVKKLRDFANLVYERARWPDASSQLCIVVQRGLAHLQVMTKKMEDSIFEIKEIIKAPKKGKKK